MKACCGEFGSEGCRCLVGQCRVWPDGIVIGNPCGNDLSCMIKTEEQRFVQKLVTHFAIEAFDKAVLRGSAWGLLPKDFPPKSTVHHYFKRFRMDGTWLRIHDMLYLQIRDLEGREASPTYAIIDSQSVKTGPEARGNTGFDAGKKIKGRKRHILVDTLGMVLGAEVHSAGIQDRDGAALVFDRLTARFPFIAKICGDGGYQGPIVQNASPRPMDIIKRNHKGFEVLPKRWVVERTFAWPGINRRMSKDVERFPETSLAFIFTAMIKLMTRRLARFLYS